MENIFRENTKKLGFGMMRLPELSTSGKFGNIDIELTKKMVDFFISEGFTYFDTAWMYCGFKSEDAAGEALVSRHKRDEFTLATKLHAGFFKNEDEMENVFKTQLAKTRVDYFDYYLLHDLGEDHYKKYQKFGCFEWLADKKKAGFVKHMGFSYHDRADLLDKILSEHPEVEFVQLQLNYLDWESEAIQSRKCYEVARKYDLPVIIMEPVKGGMLADPPEAVKKILKEASPDASCSSWAIKYAADLEGVITVLSGMSNTEQMEDNISFMKDFSGLTDGEREVLKKASDAINEVPIIPCTSCDYCAKVCPMEVGISGSFSAMNIITIYNDMEKAKNQMQWFVERQQRKHASECIRCGACEAVCPQHISIISELEKIAEAFGE